MSFTLRNTGTWYWEGQEFNNVINPATAVGIVDSDVENLADKVVGNRFTSPMGTFTGLTVYSGPGQSLASYTYKNGSETSTSAAAILAVNPTASDGAYWINLPSVGPKQIYCAMSSNHLGGCLLYTSPSPRDRQKSRMPSSA